MILADQVKELAGRAEALERCLNIAQKRIDLLNEEEKTQEPDFWGDPNGRANPRQTKSAHGASIFKGLTMLAQ